MMLSKSGAALGALLVAYLATVGYASAVRGLIRQWEDRANAELSAPVVSQDTDVSDFQDEMPKPEEPEKPADLCKDPYFSTIVRTANEHVFVFKGPYFWKVLPHEGLSEPMKISEHWPGLPDYVDAAVTLEDGLTYIFDYGKFWAYEPGTPNKLVKTGVTEEVLPGMHGIVQAIDYYPSTKIFKVYQDRRQYHIEPNKELSYRLYKEVPHMSGTNRVIGCLNPGYGPHLVFRHDGFYAEDRYESREDVLLKTTDYFGCPSRD